MSSWPIIDKQRGILLWFAAHASKLSDVLPCEPKFTGHRPPDNRNTERDDFPFLFNIHVVMYHQKHSSEPIHASISFHKGRGSSNSEFRPDSECAEETRDNIYFLLESRAQELPPGLEAIHRRPGQSATLYLFPIFRMTRVPAFAYLQETSQQ